MSRAAHEGIISSQKPRRNSPGWIESEHYRSGHLEGNLLEARKWEYPALPQEKRGSVAEKLFSPDDLEKNVELLVTEFQSLIEDFQPDVVQAHSTYVGFNRILEQCCSEPSIEQLPLIATIHGLPKPLVFSEWH